MKRTFSTLFAGAALALCLHAGAWAAQTISISADFGYDVCGNATDTTTGSPAYGDCSSLNAQSGNTVTLETGVSTFSRIFGQYDESAASSTTVTGNQVSILGAARGQVTGGFANGTAGSLNATATSNRVTVSGAGRIRSEFHGGKAWAQDDSIAKAAGNTLLIQNGSVNTGLGAGGYAQCGNNCTAEASGNTISITGGTVTGFIQAGRADTDRSGATAIASNNKVLITGGTLSNAQIFGGFADDSAIAGAAVSANDNTVEIGGTASVSGGSLYGGNANGTGALTSTGNTLKLGIGGVSVNDVRDFQSMSFSVPAATLAAGTPMLGVAYEADIDGVAISVELAASVKIGDEILLIDAAGAGGSLSGTPAPTVTSPQGYKFEIDAAALASNQLAVKCIGLPPPSSATAVPTLSDWALALLALLLFGGAAAGARRWE